MPTQLPALDIGRKSGLQGLLGSSVYAARFRLDALTNDLLEPFEHILTKKQYLLEPDQPSCLDFLAFGYLALMLYPQVPQAWLQEAMRARFPRVVDYVEHMRRRSITEQHTKPSDVWAISYGREEASKLGLHLPWRPIPPRPLSSTVSKIAQEVTSNLPILSMMYKQEPIVRADTPRVSRKVATRLPSQTTINALTSVTAAAAAGVVAMAIHHRRNPREGNLIFWALRPQAQGFGEAGNILSALTGELAMGM